MTATDPALLSATELVRHYHRRTLSPVGVVERVLGRIEKLDPDFNAFVLIRPEEALAAARAAEARWVKGKPLGLVDGVPTTIKDQLPVAGWPNRKGSKTISDAPEAADAPAVARLREHGAILLGKTTLPEFGWKGVTDGPLTGISRNPWNPDLTCGGSSGGAAIAAALGLGALHVGSDGSGSIRMPAGFCGVFGLKPSFARVPMWPYSALPDASHTGPLTRTVEDAALMLTVIGAYDVRDWHAVRRPPQDFRTLLDRGVGGLRIAWSPTLGYGWCDDEVARIVADSVRVFAELGAHVEEQDPGFRDPIDWWYQLYATNAAVTLEGISADKHEVMDPGFVGLAKQGLQPTGRDILRALVERDALGRQMTAFHEKYDLLVTPNLPLVAFAAGLEYPKGRGMRTWFDWSPYHYPFNATQQPAAAVPCGFTRAGLPVSLQIVGPRFGEEVVLQASRAFEAVRGFAMPAR